MKKTRKSMSEELLAIMRNREEYRQRVLAYPDFDKTNDLIVAYTTIEKGAEKVHYHCRKCGTHTVTNGSYASTTFTCPNCKNDKVQNRKTRINYQRDLYAEKTPNGFVAMTYKSDITFPNEPDWYKQQPKMGLSMDAMFLFDRDVGILMGSLWGQPTVEPNTSKTMDQIESLLCTRSDGRGMSHEDWTMLTQEAKNFLKKKKEAAQERAKAKKSCTDMYQFYKAKELDTEQLYNLFKIFLATTYDKNANGETMRIWCTSCGKYHDRPSSKVDTHVCPYCGHTVSELDGMNELSPVEWNKVSYTAVLVENTNLPDNDLLLRLVEIQYKISREHDKTELTLKKSVTENQRIFLGKRIRVYGNSQPHSYYCKASLKDVSSYFRTENKYVYQSNVYQSNEELLDIISKSCMAKTGLAESWGLVTGYKGLWPAPNINYIVSWYKDNRLEMLAKANVPNLAKYYVHHPEDLSPGNTLYEALHISKPAMKVIQRDNMNRATAYQFQRLYTAEQSMTLEKFRRIQELHLDISKMLSIKYSYNLSIDKILAYLDSVYDHQCIVRQNALIEWDDYLNMARKLSMDLSQKSLMFPASLKKEHDIAIFAYNALKQEVDAKQFAKTATENKAKYEYSYGNLMAIIPQTPEDIIEEATKQHNCLRSYIERVRDGATVVAFIRKKDAPDDSYISVEIYEGALSQVKLAYNKDPHSEELNEFLAHWCKACNIAPLSTF